MIALILLFALILRLVNINQSFWLDEAAQLIESARPLKEQFDILGDFQPPLFHLLLHFWMKLGNSEFIIRLFPIIISLITIYLFYLITRKIFNKKYSLLATFLLSINPFFVYYSQEVRPYPLSMLTALLITLGFLNNSYLLLIIGMTAFLYTTYFAPFFIISVFIHSLLYKREKLYVLAKSFIISLFLFFPWTPSFMSQLKSGTDLTNLLPGWGQAVSTPLNKAIPLVFAKYYFGRITIDNKIIYYSLILLLSALFAYLLFRGRKSKFWEFSVVSFFSSLFMAFFVSFVLPVIDPKRLIFILPFFILIIVSGVEKLKPISRKLVLLVVMVVFSYGLFQYFTNPRFQRENWKEATAFVETKGDGNQLVLFSFPEPFAPYLWYQKQNLGYGVAKRIVLLPEDLVKLKSIIKNRKRIYLFTYLMELTDPVNKIKSTLEAEGFVKTDTYDFSGVGFVEQYDKASYALAP